MIACFENSRTSDGKILYSESYNFGVQFAWLNKTSENEFQAVHPSVLCKDFLADVVWAEKLNRPVADVYRFYYKPGKLVWEDTLYILLHYHYNKSLGHAAESLEQFLNELDKNRPASKVWKANDDNDLIVEFPREWTSSPLELSFYTLMMRTGLNYTGKGAIDHLKDITRRGPNYSFCQYDTSVVMNGWRRIEPRLVNGRFDINNTWEEYKKAKHVHIYGGVVDFIPGNNL